MVDIVCLIAEERFENTDQMIAGKRNCLKIGTIRTGYLKTPQMRNCLYLTGKIRFDVGAYQS